MLGEKSNVTEEDLKEMVYLEQVGDAPTSKLVAAQHILGALRGPSLHGASQHLSLLHGGV